MPYRAPELFHVDSYSTVDERVDIWVSFPFCLICCVIVFIVFKNNLIETVSSLWLLIMLEVVSIIFIITSQ